MGIFIAIEGGDGSGKATQASLLEKYFRDELKKPVLRVSFPRYGQASAIYAGRYLDGDYGSADDVHPDLGSLPYAIDRFAAKGDIQAMLDRPDGIVIADRYVASNLAHQGAKLNDPAKRHKFYKEVMELEYGIFNIPKPTLNIVLIVPTEIAQANVDKKDASTRSYTDKKRDIHEQDASHLEKAKANYEELCRLFPQEFTAVQCLDDAGELRSIESINAELLELISI